MGSAAIAVVCALHLLGRSAESFPIIRVLEERPVGRAPNVEAFVDRATLTINVIATAPGFVAAHRAAKREGKRCTGREAFALLASILVHEEWHVLNGADESGAYAAQMTTLHGLGFGPHTKLYGRIWRSKLAVLSRHRDDEAARQQQKSDGRPDRALASTRVDQVQHEADRGNRDDAPHQPPRVMPSGHEQPGP